MRKLVGWLCILMAVGLGAYAVLAALVIVARAAGFIGVVVGLFVLPITGTAAPIYEIVKHGNWWPVLYVYGGSLAATFFAGLGLKLGDSCKVVKGIPELRKS